MQWRARAGLCFVAAAAALPLLGAIAAVAEAGYDVTRITLAGDTLPGSGGATFASVSGTSSLALNDAGQVLHGGIVSGGTVSCPAGSSCWGVYLATSDSVAAIALEGDSVPGTSDVFERVCPGCPPLDSISLTGQGDAAFGGFFGGLYGDTGAFVKHHLATMLAAAAVSGDPAPDSGGGTFSHVIDVSCGWSSCAIE